MLMLIIIIFLIFRPNTQYMESEVVIMQLYFILCLVVRLFISFLERAFPNDCMTIIYNPKICEPNRFRGYQDCNIRQIDR